MSGIAILGGALLMFLLLVGPIIFVTAMLSRGAQAVGAVATFAVNGPAGMPHTARTARLSAAAAAARAAADRA